MVRSKASKLNWLWISSLLFWTALYMSVATVQVQAEYTAELSPVSVGIMTGLFGAGLLVARIPIGIAFGKFNQKLLLLSGLCILAIGNMMVPVFFHPMTLFFSKLLLGIAAGYWVVYSLIYINHYSHEIPEAAARITLTYGLGILIGTVGGGVLVQQWGWLAPFWIGTGAAFGAIVIILPMEQGPRIPYSFDKGRLLALLVNGKFLLLCSLGFLMFFLGTSTVWGFTQNYAFEHLDAQPLDLGLIALAMLAPYAFSIRFAYILRTHIGVKNIMIMGFALAGIATFLIPFAHSILILSFLHISVGLGLGAVFATLMSLSVEGIPLTYRGESMGVFQTIYAVGFLLGPITAGQIAQTVGLPAIFYLNGAAAVLTAAVIVIVPFARPFGDRSL